MKITRLGAGPIIRPDMDCRMGANINGPSLIRVPDWLPDPLGRYYLYFAHHQGTYIRLAYADDLRGPWRIHEPGTLTLEQTLCIGHIASPDVHVDHDAKQIRMYFHGPLPPERRPPPDDIPCSGVQYTFVAHSRDGLHYQPDPQGQPLGNSYMRTFRWQGWTCGLAMPLVFYRSRDGVRDFVRGPSLADVSVRHSALRVRGSTLEVFLSRRGDCPEHILRTTIDLTPDWMQWRCGAVETVLMPEHAWEGTDCPLEPSQAGAARQRVRQLRDPALFTDADGRTYLLYSVAGEHGLAIAEIEDQEPA